MLWLYYEICEREKNTTSPERQSVNFNNESDLSRELRFPSLLTCTGKRYKIPQFKLMLSGRESLSYTQIEEKIELTWGQLGKSIL